ncbi:MAG: hypothetical protein VYA30_07875 [Myxococcota bacterium]|nr:hypothetical protein [Myxococcota bacterium]
MNAWLIVSTLAVILLQSGCAVFGSTRTVGNDMHGGQSSQNKPPTQHTHRFHYISDTGLDAVEITMSGFVGGGQATLIGLRHDAAESSERFVRSGDLQRVLKTKNLSNTIATMPARTPEYAGKWLAIEKSIWASAYTQGQIRHESIGRRYSAESDDNYAQHAIRQTVKVQLDDNIDCIARRKFYSEAFGFGSITSEHYVSEFRKRAGLKRNSPFGVESENIKDQVYLVKRDTPEKAQRVELHRVYTIAGPSPNELVETSFICMARALDVDSLGHFKFHWLQREKRMGVSFQPHQSPQVRAFTPPS